MNERLNLLKLRKAIVQGWLNLLKLWKTIS
jgi:hypothetical protein